MDEIEKLKEEIELLKAALNQDKTGLAKGLADVKKLCEGYNWITEGRGPYAYDDERYKGEVLNMINEISSVCITALRESGALATNAIHGLFAPQKGLHHYGCSDLETLKKWANNQFKDYVEFLSLSWCEDKGMWYLFYLVK